jgi:hypothetical protein
MVQITNQRWKGYWMSIPAFPGLIATAIIDDHGFSSLNYRTARRFRQNWMEAASRESEHMLAEVSAMFRFWPYADPRAPSHDD